MILGVGIDVVSVERVESLLERHGGRAKERLYTEIERAYCEKMAKPVLHYAARFAAKEACVKAFGTGFTSGMRWRDIGIVNNATGKPELVLEGAAAQALREKKAARALVSLTHDSIHAAAVVILESANDEFSSGN